MEPDPPEPTQLRAKQHTDAARAGVCVMRMPTSLPANRDPLDPVCFETAGWTRGPSCARWLQNRTARTPVPCTRGAFRASAELLLRASSSYLLLIRPVDTPVLSVRVGRTRNALHRPLIGFSSSPLGTPGAALDLIQSHCAGGPFDVLYALSSTSSTKCVRTAEGGKRRVTVGGRSPPL